ncbi:hypothetical protein V6N11_019243 [Hibiscus sabdariffa]|uniref:Uncharacterized protein n=1 Tax=Hibiscus sabdariffa TaxID=183260 RepID=A0ABR2R1T4_9ROSI
MDSTAWHQGRRPPNPVGVVEMPYIEDLPSLPVSPGMHPVLKKGRGVVITTYEVDDMDMVVMDDGVGEELASSKSLLGSEGRAMTVPSFRDKLIGANGGLGDMQYISELDVEVREEDENTAKEEGIINSAKRLPASSEVLRKESYESCVRRGSDSLHMNRASRRLESVLHENEVVGMGESSKTKEGVEEPKKVVAAPGKVVSAKSTLASD